MPSRTGWPASIEEATSSRGWRLRKTRAETASVPRRLNRSHEVRRPGHRRATAERLPRRSSPARGHIRLNRTPPGATMSNTDFVLAVEDLTVSFDGFKAVDALNLYVDKNELRVIIGPNGAGKTTLLDLICGKTKATAGSIKFKNRS
jgi:ATPase subunit of ABC transporter with duplicated ATPase domains